MPVQTTTDIQTTTTDPDEFPFQKPGSVSYRMRDAGLKALLRAAADVVAEAEGTELQTMLESTPNGWAWHNLTEGLHNANHKQIRDALFRYDMVQLELARQNAVNSDAYRDWVLALRPNLRDALETPIDVAGQIDPNHRRAIVAGLNKLIHLEKEDRDMEARRPQKGKGKKR